MHLKSLKKSIKNQEYSFKIVFKCIENLNFKNKKTIQSYWLENSYFNVYTNLTKIDKNY